MATSGVTTFNPNNLTILEEAFDLAGFEGRTGNDFRGAIRKLDLLKLEWANQGLNLWTVEEATISLTAGVATYSLPVDTIDLLDHSIRVGTGTDQTDYKLKRIAFSKYSLITTKNQTSSRPTSILVERQIAPSFTLWPVPDQPMTMVYWRMRVLNDAGGGQNTLDLPNRFVPAIITGLALKLAKSRPKPDYNRIQMLQGDYATQLKDAEDEDRDRSAFFIRPRIR